MRTGDGRLWSESERNEGLDDLYWDPLPHIDRMVGCALPELDGWPVSDPSSLFTNGTWDERNWRNVPGPFYGAETDTCEVGRIAAPGHVLYGNTGSDAPGGSQEFLFRQPSSRIELLRVLLGMQMDPFGGWARDGDEHWTVGLVREWWASRPRLIQWLTAERDSCPRTDEASVHQDLRGGLTAYLDYLDADLHSHLQAYAFWLDNRRVPTPGEPLPAV